MFTLAAGIWSAWGAAGGAAILLAGVSGALVFLRRTRQRRQTRETCPKCLAVGTLSAVMDGASPGLRVIHCRNFLTEVAGDAGEECGFEFLEHYRNLPKLSFTTLGAPGSGKTFWALQLYSHLIQGRYPGNVTFTRIEGPGAERFDQMVDFALNNRIAPSATQVSALPDPIVFAFQNHNRAARLRQCLVNLFDFPGEVTVRHTHSSTLRRRQLQADGYVFFLDPTLPAQLQGDALAKFVENVAALRQIPVGRQLDVPLAICLTKLDLLAAPHRGSSDGWVDRFYDRLRTIDPSGESLAPEVIDRRSELIREILPRLFPGWDMLRQAEGFFGPRWKLFPLTPVGLNDATSANAGSLVERMIEPYGICEPLLWMLDQNGAAVLPQGPTFRG
ncbi:MAG: hypothetical protein IT428_02885 [Planctomycetaceae bacterium]|nr:hypothetical protein [Planctomycetaceae bacterium]